ncbi:DUF6279 family lipoprotein [Kangiella sediminilitoris]|uniref:Lipoprotein n=1 Tax=Kangiella sediminilitoris TaxID=1144748 RepID=A0A1B3B9F0_9GAMM|nr:DUF6279 family lipoprotein [Kangiella sediminilitoris]AOE49427.1 hypothetical protein KS2013_703 [Kangiella sediminilitoris]
MNKSIRISLIAILLCILQGCGFQFWYNRLGWVSTWYADDYVTLTSAQEERIESLVDKHAKWHRLTQLPRYNQFIDDVISHLENDTLTQNYDTYGDRLIGFYHDILDQTLDDAVVELSRLSDEQVEEFMRNLDASAKEESKGYLEKSREERLEDTQEEAKDSYEEWLGDLTKEQEELIIDTVNQLKPTTEFRIQYLERWRQAFKLALAERQTESGKKAIYSLLREPRQLRTPEHIADSQHNNKLRKQLQIALYETASDEQIEHFIDYLNDYREDFSELIAEAD